MAHRSFLDRTGVAWDVWEVAPRWVERRLRQRRARAPATATVERRRSPDRRVRRNPNELRVRVTPGYERGWLAFSSRDEKRRYAPVPTGWEDATDAALEALCRQARQVQRTKGRLVE